MLPWRDLRVADATQRAYLVLVSEVMLQQTQVSRVELAYKKFIREFPSLAVLSNASNRDILLAWRGMGYNSRALRLRDAAKKIVQEFERQFPKKMEVLISIKGIGHYTAAAIRNFAFNEPEACLDTNIRRILHRVFYGPEKRDGTWRKTDKLLLVLAREVLASAGKPREWHAALMDFGSLVCTKRTPKCDHCPLAKKRLCKSAGRIRLDISTKRAEPGREIAGKFVANRIIRGRIVDFLRDEGSGAALDTIGAHVCIDWNPLQHRLWLRGIVQKLKTDALLSQSGRRYQLAR
jgi:A/G-specific adenine glycosylase